MVVIGSVWDRTVEFISDNLSAVVPIALMGIFAPLSIWRHWPLVWDLPNGWSSTA